MADEYEPPPSWRHRWRPRVECRAIIGVERRNDGTHVTICHRFKGHRGGCRKTSRRSMIESYYEINRRYYPNLSRPRALLSAWRVWRMTKVHNGGKPDA